MGAPTIGLSAFNPFQPLNFAKVPSGDMLGFNGLNRGFRWNGSTTAVHNAGVDPPTSAPTVTTPVGGGASAGVYVCYYRYLDNLDNPSNLSPVTTVTAAASDQFDWSGVANATNADGRIVKKQLWRSTVDQATTLYLVTTINDNTTTTFSSDTSTDAALIAAAAADATKRISVLNPDGSLGANRFCVPPNFKAVPCWFQDRLWLGVDVEYTQGTASFVSGSPTVTGSGTSWTAEMAGRYIYNTAGGGKGYLISSASASSITLSENYAGSNTGAVSYAIRPAPSWRNVLLFSEVDEPESMCEINTVKVQQSLSFVDDEIVGLQCHGSYMYILKDKTILRLSYVVQPKIDTNVVLAAQRGAFNNRCFDMVEDIAYIMDEAGPYRFSGDSVEAIGHKIEDYWREGTIDFTQKKWFWVRANPATETVYFAVSLSGETRPKGAFVYHYRLDAWWYVSWHTEIGGACIYPISSRPRFLLGGADDVVYLGEQGYADGIDSTTETGTMRGTATSATSTTLTDSTATFTSTMVGAPVAIVSGTGKGQYRIIASRTSTELTVTAAWTTTPDTTSVYVVGAISWSFKSKLFAYLISDQERPRALRLSYQPTTNDASLDIRRYLNHNTTPENHRIDWDQGDGLSFEDGEPDAVVNLKSSESSLAGTGLTAPGFVRYEFDSNAEDLAVVDRWVQFHLRGYGYREIIKLFSIDVEGVK